MSGADHASPSVPRSIEITGAYGWRLLAGIGAAAVGLVVLVVLRPVVLGVLLALFLATVAVPTARWLRRRGWRPSLAAAASVLMIVLVGLGATLVVTRSVVSQWNEISATVGDGRTTVVDGVADATGISDTQAADLDAALDSAWRIIGPVLSDGLVNPLPVVLSAVGTTVLSLFILFFLVKDGAAIWERAIRREGTQGDRLSRAGHRAWTTLSSYLAGQSVIAAVDATAITLGAVLLDVPFAGAIAMLTFFAAFIPTIGAILSGAVAVFLAAAEHGLPTAAVMLLIVLVVQQVESNVLQPLIVGKATHLHPLVVFLSTTIGALLAGILGMLLAVPLVAVVSAAIDELHRSDSHTNSALPSEPVDDTP